MKWKVQLIAETAFGERVGEEIATIEREQLLTPAAVGLTIEEGKITIEGLQRRIVALR